MTYAWALVLIVCTGPGPSGDCAARPPVTYQSRWDCRQAAIAREMMDERIRAYCQKVPV